MFIMVDSQRSPSQLFADPVPVDGSSNEGQMTIMAAAWVKLDRYGSILWNVRPQTGAI